MRKEYYFKTGVEGKDTIQVYSDYCKSAGGYIANFLVGDTTAGGMFGWHIDADYFRYYQRHDRRLLVPAGRRSAKKEQEAEKLLADNLIPFVRDFVAQSEALGGPHMEPILAA